jgi:cytochrome bd-type quinol oxidase subunit 2
MKVNKVTRIIVATIGSIFGLSGMSHGVFEILQGNRPTGGVFIAAIGDAQKMWKYGDEYAFSLIPNFLITGIVAMLVSLTIVVWSIGFTHKKHGSTMLFLLFILLFLVGGGVAQIVLFPFVCLVSTRINKPLKWWRKVLPIKIHKPLGKLWLWCLAIVSFLFAFALQIAITGFVPGISDPEKVLSFTMLCLGLAAILLPLTFISGFAQDIAMRPNLTLDGR